MKTNQKQIGIIGGGPAGLFMYKRLVESGEANLHITIFERNNQLGAGMPYSTEGSGIEHVTNVSDNEVPTLVTSVENWLQTVPPHVYEPFGIHPQNFNEYKVLPRLLFGQYLSAQFELLHQLATKMDVTTKLFINTTIIDIDDDPSKEKVCVTTQHGKKIEFDNVVVCTGHHWPIVHEGKIPGWFDSPYPPKKLNLKINYPVAIKGASLTAVDALRTLARANGKFVNEADGSIKFELNDESKSFRLILHALDGLLPALRFHLDDPLLHRDYVLSETELQQLKKANGGFVPLDYIFEHSFKKPIQQHEPELYERIQNMTMEQFVAEMMSLRERLDPFVLFKAEYAEAEKSIRRRQSVYWKEMLAVFSYTLNYPAKHFSAEDMMRLKKVLMPLISIVIAFVPQSSYHELIALYDAGILDLIDVDRESKVEPLPEGGALYTYTDDLGKQVQKRYNLYVNATGQPAFMYPEFPFPGLVKTSTVSPAYVAFKSNEAGKAEAESGNSLINTNSQGNYFLQVPGIQINDYFQVLDKYGAANQRIYMMAVPYISGLNPDYSGLDFCEEASARIVSSIVPPSSQSDAKDA
jgi:hypothetical protein